MRKSVALVFSFLLLAACSPKSDKPATQVSKEPVSVRGWIADVESTGTSTLFRTVETEAARKAQMFQAANVWIDNAPYVSGGIAENGAFVLLDVPPGDVTISFSAPGVPVANITLKNVPANADVILPGIVLKPSGEITIGDPADVKVRIAGAVLRPKPTPRKAIVGGIPIPVMEVPVKSMMDRRDYLNPPSLQAPVATVK